MVRFGPLTIGEEPRVVAVLSSYEGLQRFAELKSKPCELAEVRLDLIGPERDWMPLAKLLQASGTPVILTLRAAFEGGKWDGTDEERLKILTQAAGNVSAVDVELKSNLGEQLKKRGIPVIVSFHDFARTPPLDVLADVVWQAQQVGDVAKVSTMVQTDDDLKTLRGLLRPEWAGPVCIIGMGPKGEVTRTEFPRAGSCLTYGYFEASAAPGQLPAEKLMAHLGKPVPGL
jgi:3-dehydroquinate dehydratase I